MNTLTHLSINLFPVVMLLVIYTNNHKKTVHTRNRRQFNLLTLLTIVLMCVDVGRYRLEETYCKREEVSLWVLQMSYTVLIVVIAGVWLIYVFDRLYEEEHSHRVRWIKRIVAAVSVLYAALVAATPWTHFIFYYTDDRQFVQGKGYHLQYLLGTLMLFGSIAASGHACFHENSRERRRECLYLMCFGIVPFIGMELQHCMEKWWIAAPCVALSIQVVYMSTQNRQITTDGLTGLNNRMDFDLHLKKREEQYSRGEWGMLMMDVDDFKSINDNFGHTTGDEALWETADLLRRTFGRNGVFLARYGGDEFVVIANWNDADEVRADIARVEAEVAAFNQKGEKPYRLSFSIGYALWSETEQNVDALVKKADERMYQKKMKKKEGRKSSRI